MFPISFPLRVGTDEPVLLLFSCFCSCSGDKRSFSMVRTTAQRLAGEKRKGWAVVRVISEMCDALVRLRPQNNVYVLAALLNDSPIYC